MKNWWGLLTGDDGVGIMKIVTKVNGKDVLWRLYTLGFLELRQAVVVILWFSELTTVKGKDFD